MAHLKILLGGLADVKLKHINANYSQYNYTCHSKFDLHQPAGRPSPVSPPPPAPVLLGLKNTQPRKRVMAAFRRSSTRHLSAEDVYRIVAREGETLSLSTVYKVLSQFEQAGVLRRSDLGQARTVFELNDCSDTHHGHLVCTHTGEVLEFQVPELEKHLRELAAAQGLVLTHWSVTAWAVASHDTPPPSPE
jgi:Fur family ferric uptake transcriptional regulator